MMLLSAFIFRVVHSTPTNMATMRLAIPTNLSLKIRPSVSAAGKWLTVALLSRHWAVVVANNPVTTNTGIARFVCEVYCCPCEPRLPRRALRVAWTRRPSGRRLSSLPRFSRLHDPNAHITQKNAPDRLVRGNSSRSRQLLPGFFAGALCTGFFGVSLGKSSSFTLALSQWSMNAGSGS